MNDDDAFIEIIEINVRSLIAEFSNANVDRLWRRPDRVVAVRLGCTLRFAKAARSSLGQARTIFTRRSLRKRARNIAIWSNWDWSAIDSDLARDHGLSRERVGQIRKILFGRRGSHGRHR